MLYYCIKGNLVVIEVVGYFYISISLLKGMEWN